MCAKKEHDQTKYMYSTRSVLQTLCSAITNNHQDAAPQLQRRVALRAGAHRFVISHPLIKHARELIMPRVWVIRLTGCLVLGVLTTSCSCLLLVGLAGVRKHHLSGVV